jgi:hypothetical protein
MSNSTGTTTVLPPRARLYQSSKHPAPFPHLIVCPRRLHQFLCPHATNSRLLLLPHFVKGKWLVDTLQIVDSVTAVRWKTYVLRSEVPGSNYYIRILTIYFILISSGSWRSLVCHVVNVSEEISVSFFRLTLRWTVRYYDLEDHNLVFAALKI